MDGPPESRLEVTLEQKGTGSRQTDTSEQNKIAHFGVKTTYLKIVSCRAEAGLNRETESINRGQKYILKTL